MKRRDLIRHLEVHDCKLLREGANHTVYVNRLNRKYLQFRDIVRLMIILPEKSAEIYKFQNHRSVSHIQ